MDKVIVYGIPNCGSVKKAISWLEKNNIEFSFHDYKKKGITEEKLIAWIKKSGWEILFNKKGTTWRAMADQYENKVLTEKMALRIMMENTSIIKRPVIEIGKQLIVGYEEPLLEKILG